MNIRPIAPTEPACYGVACAQHANCQRYAAVKEAQGRHVIYFCGSGDGERPMFVALKQELQ
jgi:hypothetical protein